MFKPKWKFVPQETRDKIIEYAKEHSPNMAGVKFAKKIGMHPTSVSIIVNKILQQEHITPKYVGGKPKEPSFYSKDGKWVFKKKAIKLTEKEKDLLKRLGEGKATFDEVSKMVAVKVFEKMLKNPDDFKFYDFYQTELLQIKKQEVEDRNTWAMEIINRFFMGKLPPQICPKCGTKLYEVTGRDLPEKHLIEEGELVQNGSKLTSRKI
jgi:hypothetical protein